MSFIPKNINNSSSITVESFSSNNIASQNLYATDSIICSGSLNVPSISINSFNNILASRYLYSDVSGNINITSTSVSVGPNAGRSNNNNYSVSIGNESGYLSGPYCVAVGNYTGRGQGTNCTAVGESCANSGQSNYATAIGNFASQTNQGLSATSVGNNAGRYSQGNNSVAIGAYAGQTNQHANSIVISATGSALNTGYTNSCYIGPIRATTGLNNVLFYDTATKEVQSSDLVRYDSGWFAVVENTSYSKTHNLNLSLSLPPRYILLFSPSATTPSATAISGTYDITNQGIGKNDYFFGYALSHTSANAVTIRTSIYTTALYWSGSAWTQSSAGFYRLYIFY